MTSRMDRYAPFLLAAVAGSATYFSFVSGIQDAFFIWTAGGLSALVFFAKLWLWRDPALGSAEAFAWCWLLVTMILFIGWRLGGLQQSLVFAAGTTCAFAVYVAVRHHGRS